MKIRAKLFADLEKDRRPGRERVVEVEEAATVEAALRQLKIPLNRAKILLLNGRHAKLETRLEEDDVLAVFPPVAGG